MYLSIISVSLCILIRIVSSESEDTCKSIAGSNIILCLSSFCRKIKQGTKAAFVRWANTIGPVAVAAFLPKKFTNTPPVPKFWSIGINTISLLRKACIVLLTQALLGWLYIVLTPNLSRFLKNLLYPRIPHRAHNPADFIALNSKRA